MRRVKADAPMEFKFEGFSCLSFAPPFLMPRSHSHNEVELNYLVKGNMSYLHGGQVVTMGPEQLVVFWGTMPHQVISRDEKAQLFIVNIPMPWFLQWRLPAQFSQDIVRGTLVQDPIAGRAEVDKTLFQGWFQYLQDSDPEKKKVVALEVEARLRRLAIDWGKAHPGERRISDGMSSGGGAFEKIERITNYISENYSEPLKVEDIAQAVDLHPNYTMNLFQKHCGLSLIEYLTQHRVAHAQRLLATTDAKVLDVALQSGFGSASRFYAAFMKVCGRSPRDFRTSLAFAVNHPGVQPDKTKFRDKAVALLEAAPQPAAKAAKPRKASKITISVKAGKR